MLTQPATFTVMLLVGVLLIFGALIVRGATCRERRECPVPSCRHKNPASARFCARCGHKLTDE